jgi:hypothetical protein
MTRADILVKYSRRTLADMIIDLQHQVTTLEEQSFDYATRAMRAEIALDLIDPKSELPYVLTTNPPKS